MSTRSGKRIHNSFHENVLMPGVEQVGSERKTRSRRLKDNIDESSVSLLKNKKRVNYVSYPSDEDVGTDTVDSKEDKSTRLLRKNALKEQNNITSSKESVEPLINIKKTVKTTRRTRTFADGNQENLQENHNHVEEEVNFGGTQKSKKGKKKRLTETEQDIEEIVVSKKHIKKKKQKKGRSSGSMIVEHIKPKDNRKNSLNKSNMSIDSFHSAAGSPGNEIEDNALFEAVRSPRNDLEIENTTFEKHDLDEKRHDLDEKPVEKTEGRKTRSATRQSSCNISPRIPDKTMKESRKRKLSTKDLDKSITNETLDTEINDYIDKEKVEKLNTTKVSKKRKSTVKDTVSEVIIGKTIDEDIKNSFNLQDLEERKSIKNATFDKTEASDKVNTTYDKDDNLQTTKSVIIDTTFDKSVGSGRESMICDEEPSIDVLPSATKSQSYSVVINTTFEKSENNSQIASATETLTQEPTVVNTTFEMDSGTNTKSELKTRNSSIKNSTFEIDEINSETSKKNLRMSILSISSQKVSTEINTTIDKTEKDTIFDTDKKLDVTFDKSSKSSLISSDTSEITLDKSDVSRISITSDDSKDNIVNRTPVLIESSLDESRINTFKLSPKSPAKTPLTPLKREGTFTKDGPEVEPEQPSVLKTPTKRMSLPSPGFTPFHVNKSSSKEKSVLLNITRSIEKSRRSSLAEPLPRTTKVMFCSPVNNPAVVLQQRRKVIKSNLKGSNKSFVFDDSAIIETAPAPRKRSYTQSDADDARAKRKRLADGLQHSVDRLSRPRTCSASAKLAEPTTPTKKPGTPSKKSGAKIARTKLPNFAALHQKEFAKMESLDECQERKAKRAKQLLTPTGAVTVLERSSPKDNAAEPRKSPNAPEEQKNEKQRAKETKKPETPVKSLPTLKSINPGYTRFGFKLNLDVNPFSIQTKTDQNNYSNVFNFANKKDSKAKSRLFSFSSKKDNTKPLKEIKANLTRQATLPSLTGTTSARREIAKQSVMREKSFTDKRNINRNENRTVIKGVRTNRRFELQMRMRNID